MRWDLSIRALSNDAQKGNTMPKKIEDVTQKIINAALEIYHKEGYDSLSMRRIAEVSGRAVGTVYTHFEDKEALLAQVLAGEIE